MKTLRLGSFSHPNGDRRHLKLVVVKISRVPVVIRAGASTSLRSMWRIGSFYGKLSQ